MTNAATSLYRHLPQLGELLESAALVPLLQTYSRALVADVARSTLAQLRDQLKAGKHSEASVQIALAGIVGLIEQSLLDRLRPSLRRVINATGVILQTNLGRAPLSEAAIDSIAGIARSYCNLEFDLATGERSRRDVHAEDLVLDLLAQRGGRPLGSMISTHGAAVVNNCAAATLLALNTLAEGGEVIVSRGELVEIGGGFRIPDILRKSGATLREVGTTNRTRLSDYSEAITPQTRLILRVHRSNFRMEGFTEQPTLEELIELSKKTGVPLFEDQGTGCIVALEDLDDLGLRGESSFVASATNGAALIAASGDKLLGGPQCGLLVGERSILARIRANPLFRALRVDKLTYAALQATLLAYLRGDDASIPTIAMLRLTPEALATRCETMSGALQSSLITAEAIATQSVVGGGTTPGASLPSVAVALQHKQLSESALAAHLRALNPAVIARTHEGRVLLDLRTVRPEDDSLLLDLLRSVHSIKPGGEAPL